MKLNKWTLGLAAVGLVSLTSVQAEEVGQPLLTALTSTTISGYVDTSFHFNPGRGVGAYAFGAGKADGFNLNSVLVSLEKPLEEGEWSAGYRADLQYGPDADAIVGPQTSFASENIRQAYVALRAPLGNGLDIKLGRFDTIIGYESSDGYKNPNYTRSYAWSFQPTTHTGVLATYQALDFLSVNAGVAETLVTGPINARSPRGTWNKTYMGSVAITAPEELGVLAGSALYAGVIDGFGGNAGEDQTSWYAGATLATPVEGLRLGAAFDFVQDPGFFPAANDIWTVGVYASFRATDKLGLHLRGEYVDLDVNDGWAATATVDYSLWDNVLSRVEGRWDHGSATNAGGTRDSFLVAANLIYKF
ncbi:MAG: outer membrane beta-barrel protein [Limisphaerales bacterium]